MAGNKIAVENAKLRFARQLFETTVERHGADHEQARLLREYISELEHEDWSTHAIARHETAWRRHIE